MEYMKVNNSKTALISFDHAKKLAGPNPAVYNEIGCINVKEKQFELAKKYFKRALKYTK